MAGPTALLTLADAKTQLEISSTTTTFDTELQGYIDSATEVVEDYVGPVIQRDVVEYHDGGRWELQLRTRPVVSVTSIVETWGPNNYTLSQVSDLNVGVGSAYDFTLDSGTGTILRRAYGVTARFPIGQKNVKVTYVAGRAAVPAAVDGAMKIIVQHLWKTRLGPVPGQDPYTDQLVMLPGFGFAIPSRAVQLLTPQRRVPGFA